MYVHCYTLYVFLYYTGKSFVERIRYLFTLPDVKSFLSQRICQDPLERFSGANGNVVELTTLQTVLSS